MLLDAVRMLLRMCSNAPACTLACASHTLPALPHALALLIRYMRSRMRFSYATRTQAHALPHALLIRYHMRRRPRLSRRSSTTLTTSRARRRELNFSGVFREASSSSSLLHY